MQFVQPGMEAATRMVNITDITWNKQHRKKHDWEFVFMNCFICVNKECYFMVITNDLVVIEFKKIS